MQALHDATHCKNGSTMLDKTASVHWEGPGKTGQGQISTETGALDRHPYGFATRFEDDRRGTNPEEILAAAHAA
jgi:osmotically inducible protein OsmC